MATACQFILPRTRVSQSVAMNSLRERVYSAWKSGSAASPAIKTLGIRMVKLDEGRSLMEMDVSERLHNLSGTMHGGVMGDIADAAMGVALATTLGPDEDFTTIEFKISFLRPHVSGLLRAEGSLAKRGRRIAFTEATLTNAENQVIAKTTGTCLLTKARAKP
ncbi:PaaI family thioesterase [Candidatus Bathyarchaeota archaeon]|nr:MAG: PaaI family thioesterase [Candidatus Bathyarchaeota archaeon]